MNIEDIMNLNALVFGDYMVDKYIVGNVRRISPEAPVPVLEVTSKESKLGGAGNVVNNIIALGAAVRTIGYVGSDDDGSWLIAQLERNGADISFMKKLSKVHTICKTRVISRHQQFLRYDEERIEDIPADYELFIIENMDKIMKGIHVVVISDYNKGAVRESVLQHIIEYAKASGIPVIVDPKGKDYNKYRGATICTPNTDELSVVSNQNLNSEEAVLKAGIDLCRKTDLQYLLLTRSEKGISLFIHNKNEKIDFPSVPKEVIDVTGAGDTVVSVVALLYAAKFSIEECCRIANIAASVVISKFGASTISNSELIHALSNNMQNKLLDKSTVESIVKNLKNRKKKIVFTNGCFDLLHAGHLSSLKKAKSFGDVLIVAVNSDESVKRLKGDLRPIISQMDRIELLSALECVDYVILMEDDTPVNLIRLIKPDISVKGIDWKDKLVPEKSIIEEMGGKIEFIELEAGLSTTNIIKKIVTSCNGDTE